MTVKELCDTLGWELAYGEGEKEISGGVYCCDLLSLVMGRAPEGCVWITVMGNVNAMAVATLADTACVVLAENMPLDDEARAGAEKGKVTVIRTDKPIFEAATLVASTVGII